MILGKSILCYATLETILVYLVSETRKMFSQNRRASRARNGKQSENRDGSLLRHRGGTSSEGVLEHPTGSAHGSEDCDDENATRTGLHRRGWEAPRRWLA